MNELSTPNHEILIILDSERVVLPRATMGKTISVGLEENLIQYQLITKRLDPFVTISLREHSGGTELYLEPHLQHLGEEPQ